MVKQNQVYHDSIERAQYFVTSCTQPFWNQNNDMLDYQFALSSNQDYWLQREW
jgi:hypothetical protein